MARVIVMHEEKKRTKKWRRIFSEPPAKDQSINDKREIRKEYVFWRNSIFITSYILYVIAYMARKNFSIAMPFMENEVGVSALEQGLVLMVASFVYGVGRFVNGSIADRGNVRVSLPINMILAGAFNAAIPLVPFLVKTQCFSHNAVVVYMCLFWGISSWYQSALFPYCAKSLIRWFPNATRATWWANWSTSHELGSFLAMNISLPIANLAYACFGKYGFEAMFVVPFVFSLLIGIVGFFALRDRPVSIGLPDVEEICETKLEALTEEEKLEQDLEDDLSYFQILKKHILCNKVMWNLALIYFCVYIFRMGPVDWIFKILVGKQPCLTNFHEAARNIDSLAALKSSMLCAIGFFGIFFAPIISEKWFKGRRAPANFWCLVVGAFSVLGIWLGSSPFSPVANMPFWKNVLTFISLGVAGFTVCVPQVLVGGIAAVESTSKKVAAAASGFTGFLGYFGASLSHAVNGKVLEYSMAKHGDARLVLVYWGLVSLMGALLCIPLWNVRARKEYSH